VNARRGKTDHRVPDRNVRPRQQCAAFGRADGKTRKVVVALFIETGHFGGFAADQRATGFAAAFGNSGNDGGGRLRIEFAAGEIIKKEQWLGALHDQIVDRHRHQVDADAAMQPGFDRDLDLGADAIGCRDQNRVLEAGGLQIEQAAEPADFGVGAGARGGPNHRLDQIDQPIARIDIDAGIRVSEPVFAVDHGPFQMMAAGYVGIRQRAMPRKPPPHILCRQQPVRAAKGRILYAIRPVAGKRRVSIPNIITLGRILLVPVIIWAIASNQMEIAFAIFVVAGVSDAVDGFLAKRFNMASELGALLDPLADKALLVSIYMALGIWGAVPRWIVILVVSRDIMIVTAVIVSWLFGKPIPMKPLMVSKLNTVAQVAFAALVLAALGFGFNSTPYDLILMGLVTVFTLVSVSLYLVEWVRHMSTIEAS